MNSRLKQIKHIWWDLDDTLYPFNREYHNKKIEAMVIEFARLKKCSIEEAKKLYTNYYRKYKSSSETFKHVFNKPNYYSQELQNKVDRRKYIKFNPKMVSFFKSFFDKCPLIKHSIISNSFLDQVKITLEILKLPEKWFANIVSTTDMEASKPHSAVYKKIIELSGLKPFEIIYVGDREEVDIIPAKKEGIVTVLVSDKDVKSEADFKVKSVYDVLGLFD